MRWFCPWTWIMNSKTWLPYKDITYPCWGAYNNIRGFNRTATKYILQIIEWCDRIQSTGFYFKWHTIDITSYMDIEHTSTWHGNKHNMSKIVVSGYYIYCWYVCCHYLSYRVWQAMIVITYCSKVLWILATRWGILAARCGISQSIHCISNPWYFHNTLWNFHNALWKPHNALWDFPQRVVLNLSFGSITG